MYFGRVTVLARLYPVWIYNPGSALPLFKLLGRTCRDLTSPGQTACAKRPYVCFAIPAVSVWGVVFWARQYPLVRQPWVLGP